MGWRDLYQEQELEEIRPLEKSWHRPENSFPASRAVVRGCGRYELMVQPAPYSSGFVVSGSMFSVNRPGHQQSGSLGSRWFANEQDARKAANGELRRLCRRST